MARSQTPVVASATTCSARRAVLAVDEVRGREVFADTAQGRDVDRGGAGRLEANVDAAFDLVAAGFR